MHLIRITAPAELPVTLAEMKNHLRVDFDDDDAQITGFMRAATERLDGRDGLLGLCLLTQTWKLTLDRFSPVITIPLPPIQSVTSIAYTDAAGDVQTLDPSAYVLVGVGTIDGSTIRAAQGWPATSGREAVTITFISGFGNTAAQVPEPIRNSIKMTAAHLYEHRESVFVGSGFITETPAGADDLIHNFRRWSF